MKGSPWKQGILVIDWVNSKSCENSNGNLLPSFTFHGVQKLWNHSTSSKNPPLLPIKLSWNPSDPQKSFPTLISSHTDNHRNNKNYKQTPISTNVLWRKACFTQSFKHTQQRLAGKKKKTHGKTIKFSISFFFSIAICFIHDAHQQIYTTVLLL